MAFTRIKEQDLLGKGVVGLNDVPGLSTRDMQDKFEEVSLKVIVPAYNRLCEEVESTIGQGGSIISSNIRKIKINESNYLQVSLDGISFFSPDPSATLVDRVGNDKDKVLITELNGVIGAKSFDDTRNILNVKQTFTSDNSPTTSNVGNVGDDWIDVVAKKRYTCVKVDNGVYTWEELAKDVPILSSLTATIANTEVERLVDALVIKHITELIGGGKIKLSWNETKQGVDAFHWVDE